MRTLILSFILSVSALFAQAAEVGGVKFSDTTDVAGQTIELNGLGIRYRTVIKVYAAALYLPKKTLDANEALSMPGAKKFSAVMLREIDGDTLGRLLMQGIRDNNSQSDVGKHLVSISHMGQSFGEKKRLVAGDTFSIDFDPKAGPTFKVNDKLLGVPSGEPSFNALLLRIWLGDKPADEELKKAMLGFSPVKRTPAYRK